MFVLVTHDMGQRKSQAVLNASRRLLVLLLLVLVLVLLEVTNELEYIDYTYISLRIPGVSKKRFLVRIKLNTIFNCIDYVFSSKRSSRDGDD